MIWSNTSDGIYSTRAAYNWMLSRTRPNDAQLHDWSKLWKMGLPENIKFFLWLILNNSLPTNSFRVHRHLTLDPSCQRCGSNSETILHCIRDCPQAARIWRYMGFQYDHSNAHDLTWFTSQLGGNRAVLFAVISWFIWKVRNIAVFEDVTWEPWLIQSKIHSLCSVIHQAYRSTKSSKQNRLVVWKHPTEEFVKLNVDGSSLGNPGHLGFGGIIRNFDGAWMMGFSGYCGFTTNISAELFAIAHGLACAWDGGHRKVICESDSLMALTMVEQGVNGCHPHATMVNHIRGLRNREWELQFSHVLREGNGCADWLAKQGSSTRTPFSTYLVCPPELSSTLLADTLGVARLRLA